MTSASANDAEFAAAVAETTVKEPAPAEPPVSEEPKRPGFFSRFWTQPEPAPVGIIVKDKWARGVIKLSFVPLAKYDHPAWRLTDGEAELARPEVQKMLQALSNRITPRLLARFEKRWPEFFDAVVAMGSLYLLKYQLVKKVVEQEEKEKAASRPSAPEPVPIAPSAARSEKTVSSLPFHCYTCNADFTDWGELQSHDCPGPQPG